MAQGNPPIADMVSPLPRREWVALVGAIALTTAVNLGPVHEMVERSFSAHMLQHMVLIMIVAPMLSVAWPFIAEMIEDALAAIVRQKTLLRIMQGMTAVMRPVPALMISSTALWVWHIPRVYDAAVANDALHTIEHLIFVVAFIPFWRPLISDRRSVGHLQSNGLRVLYLSLGMLAHGILGTYLTLTSRQLYSVYAGREPGGRSALADQQLGGAFMWIIATLAITVAAIATMKDEP